MSFERFQAVFFTTIVIFGFVIGLIGGLLGWIVAGPMVLGITTMFAYGCHKAAMREKQKTLKNLADPLLDHQDIPRS